MAAHALIGVHRPLIGYARRKIVDGVSPERATRDLLTQADAALAHPRGGPGCDAVRQPR